MKLNLNNYSIIAILGFISLFCLSIVSCKTKVQNNIKSNPKKCSLTFKDDFSGISNVIQNYVFAEDTLFFNSIKYECTHSSLYTRYIMYNLHGKWHKSVKPDNSFHTYLIWDNIDLFENEQKYTVVAYGAEKVNDIYSSVMVFDDKGRDMLSESSEIKTDIIDFFSTEIKKPKDKKKNSIFYQTYIKQFAPEYWKKYKKFPNVKIYIE